MNSKFLLIFIVTVSPNFNQVLGATETYIGAVVEYSPLTKGISEEEVVLTNVANYEEFIEEASRKGADIIVFPEFGLGTKTYLSNIPDPVDEIRPWNPTAKFNTTRAVVRLSDAAYTHKIYVVVNLPEKYDCKHEENCPSFGYHKYNTNVVFDRDGTVIARYRKFNLFDEIGTSVTEEPEMSFFDTDFEIRFGIFTNLEFLINVQTLRQLVHQYGITDFVVPCQWFNELPFLTAVQAQAGWAEANDVNLLASGYNNPNTGNTGSGIYNGKFGALEKVFEEKKTSKLLIAQVPKISRKNSFLSNHNERSKPFSHITAKTISLNQFVESDNSNTFKINLLKDQMIRFSSERITPGEIFDKKVCQGDFCCNFFVKMNKIKEDNKTDKFYYRAVVGNGVRKFGLISKRGVQSCGVVLCDGPEIDNCANRAEDIPGVFEFREISIEGDFRLKNAFQMASTLTDGKELATLPTYKYYFKREDGKKTRKVSLDLEWKVSNLHTFAIWGRDFRIDGEEPTSSSIIELSIIKYFIAVLCLFLIIFLLFVIIRFLRDK